MGIGIEETALVNDHYYCSPYSTPPILIQNISVLASSLSTSHKLESSRKRKPQLRKCLLQLGM